MKITLTTGKGEGNTLLSAFDEALMDAGVHNYNLICLSSIIPPNSDIVREKYETQDKDFGKRLYVVMAREQSDKKGEFIGSAVGYYHFPDDSRKGVFVEHHFKGSTYDEVYSLLHNTVTTSVSDLLIRRGVKDFNKEDIKMIESISEVKDKPTAVLSIAVYKTEEW